MKSTMSVIGLALVAATVLVARDVSNMVPVAQGSVSFAKAINLVSPVLYPTSLAAGDLNGSGFPGLAVVGNEDPDLLHAVGKGNGHFGYWSHSGGTGGAPGFVFLADVDGDGNLDAVTADAMRPLVTIAFGDGKGNFDRGVRLDTGVGFAVSQVAVADLNGDGIPDIVGTTVPFGNEPGEIFVFLGAGNRRFEKAVHFASGGAQPIGIAVGDLNHDGIPDLVIANWGHGAGPYGNLSVLLGEGGGRYGKPVSYPAGIHPHQLVLGDFNGDGNLDVAVTSNLDIRVFLGAGDGSLSKGIAYFAGQYPTSIATADFNADGIPDLVVSNYTSPKPCHVSVLLGKGDGTFQRPVHFRVGLSPVQVITADFTHDGKPDIATINGGDSTISILLNTTKFPPPSSH